MSFLSFIIFSIEKPNNPPIFSKDPSYEEEKALNMLP